MTTTGSDAQIWAFNSTSGRTRRSSFCLEMDEFLHAEVLSRLQDFDDEERHESLDLSEIVSLFYTHLASWLTWQTGHPVGIRANVYHCEVKFYGHEHSPSEIEAEERAMQAIADDEDLLDDATRAVFGELGGHDLKELV